MLNEQQVGKLINRLVDPVLEATLEETNGILGIEVIKPDRVILQLALADPEVDKVAFSENIQEMLGQFGFEDIVLDLHYLASDVIDSILEQREGILSESSKTKFIAVASGKGGVGKSTVAANLAVALASRDKKVGVLDADIYGFSLPVLFGEMTAPKKEGNFIIPVETHGVKMISMDFFVESGEPVIWRGPMLGKMVKMFLEEVKWGELDYLIIDLPPGTGDVALDIHTLLPSCYELIVTTPHYAAAQVASRAGYMARKNGHHILGVVENMTAINIDGHLVELFGVGGGKKVAADLDVDLLTQLWMEQPNKNTNGYVDGIYNPEDLLNESFLNLADKVIVKFDISAGSK
ncbi:P-loop NTPase [Listeria aquatica]|uniref:P-loop NTPase n=1 Tax=Listeria aquatica TaxID=1494960 RepID=UPI003EF3C117